MNIIAVDDEQSALQALERAIKQVIKDANVKYFQFSDEALAYAKENIVDVAFLDIEMNEMNGLLLAKHLKDIDGKVNIIFITGYSRYAMEAFTLRASGYVMKPFDSKQIAKELENLRYPALCNNKGIRIQCFGNFEIFVEGIPLVFSRSKTKELLAYLVNRGGAWCKKNEIIAKIWEEREDSKSLQVQYRQLVADLIATLNTAGFADIILRRRGELAIVTDKCNCDYFDFMNGEVNAINAYNSEFMEQYSWAEFTKGMLSYLPKKR